MQLAPFVLRNLQDAVLEVAAIGVAALAVERCVRAIRGDGGFVAAGLAIALVAATSPYFAVYLALGCALAVPATWDRWRSWARLAVAGALGCALVLAPLLAVEGGEGGRLGPRDGPAGYQLQAAPLVSPDEPVVRSARRHHGVGSRSPDRARIGSPGRTGPQGGPEEPERHWILALHRVPAGVALALAGLGGLLVPVSRRWAVLGLVFFLGGPGLGWCARLAGVRLAGSTLLAGGPLGALLQHLPLTAAMGNTSRMLAAAMLAWAVAGALLATRWRWTAALLGLVALGEAWVLLPGLVLPATRASANTTVLAALAAGDDTGSPLPTVVFPSGDPPAWHPAVAPKEVLYLAGRGGFPVAYDFGRGRVPEDVRALLRLSQVADAPIGLPAVELAGELPGDDRLWGERPFEAILVLEDRLLPDQRTRLLAWLEAHSRPLARGPGTSAWAMPARHRTGPDDL